MLRPLRDGSASTDVKLARGLAAAGLLLAGCGVGAPGGLDPDFVGTWVGGTSVSAGNFRLGYPTSISVSVDGTSLSVGGICPDGSGTVSARGSGRSASWDGSLTCPLFVDFSDGCTLQVTFTSLSLTLSADGERLDGAGGGTLLGCSAPGPMSAVLSGVPPCLRSGKPCSAATAQTCCSSTCGTADHTCT